MSGFQDFLARPQRGNGGDPLVRAVKKAAPRTLSAAEIKEAISKSNRFSKKPLLPAALSDEERIAEAGRLMALARDKLNGFANKAAEASSTPIISQPDCLRVNGAYEHYAEAADLYKDVLAQLWPESSEAMKVKQLLIDAHKFGIDAINCNIEAVEFAPKEKRHKLYSHWEGCITEAIRQLYALGG